MKKIFTLFFLGLLTYSSYSQCTPDDEYKDRELGAFPTAEEGLKKAEIGRPYEQVLSIKIPASYNGNTIEKGELKNMTGLPDGFTYECSEADCIYEPGFHCLVIKGTAKLEQKGIHDLSFDIVVYASPLGSLPLTYDDYKLEVIEATSVNDIEIIPFGVNQNSPNPFSTETTFKIRSITSLNLNFSVMDLVGKEVFTDKIMVSAGESSYRFSANDLNKGIYLYRISDGVNAVTKRMIIE